MSTQGIKSYWNLHKSGGNSSRTRSPVSVVKGCRSLCDVVPDALPFMICEWYPLPYGCMAVCQHQHYKKKKNNNHEMYTLSASKKESELAIVATSGSLHKEAKSDGLLRYKVRLWLSARYNISFPSSYVYKQNSTQGPSGVWIPSNTWNFSLLRSSLSLFSFLRKVALHNVHRQEFLKNVLYKLSSCQSLLCQRCARR